MTISFGSNSVLANKIYQDPARHLYGDKTTTLISRKRCCFVTKHCNSCNAWL